VLCRQVQDYRLPTANAPARTYYRIVTTLLLATADEAIELEFPVATDRRTTSPLGQSRLFDDAGFMSGLPPNAEIDQANTP
jgi:hypothetical protein